MHENAEAGLPPISVCMTTYNGARHVRAQVASVLAQLGDADELLISDDGSTDGTQAVLDSFGDHRIRLFRNGFHDITRNFDFVLRHARGEVVFLADQDDEWLDGKVRACCEALVRNILVVTDCVVADADGHAVIESYFERMRSGPGLLRNFWRNRHLGCCMAFRRELLQLALPIPNDVAHDYWIGMVAQFYGETCFLPRKLLAYRRKDNAAIHATFHSTRPILTRIRGRMVLARRLAERMLAVRAARGMRPTL
jgi:glycosyltransferase involved in cell wall biosynthesis